MAQSAHIEIKVDVTEARRSIKRALTQVQEANRELAKLEDRLAEYERRYAEVVRAAYRIEVETPTKGTHDE